MLTDEIKARLAAESLVPTGYEVIRGKVPATPDKVIVLREGGGAGPERFLGGSASLDQPSLQVIVRGGRFEYDPPRLVIERIYRAAEAWGAFTVSGVRYLGLAPLQAPGKLRDDDNDRIEFAVNFLVVKEASPLS